VGADVVLEGIPSLEAFLAVGEIAEKGSVFVMSGNMAENFRFVSENLPAVGKLAKKIFLLAVELGLEHIVILPVINGEFCLVIMVLH
jgi:hypothetical protein